MEVSATNWDRVIDKGIDTVFELISAALSALVVWFFWNLDMWALPKLTFSQTLGAVICASAFLDLSFKRQVAQETARQIKEQQR